MTINAWHVEKDGKSIGPFTIEEVRQLAASGVLASDAVLVDPSSRSVPAADLLSDTTGLRTVGDAAAVGDRTDSGSLPSTGSYPVPPPPPPPPPPPVTPISTGDAPDNASKSTCGTYRSLVPTRVAWILWLVGLSGTLVGAIGTRLVDAFSQRPSLVFTGVLFLARILTATFFFWLVWDVVLLIRAKSRFPTLANERLAISNRPWQWGAIPLAVGIGFMTIVGGLEALGLVRLAGQGDLLFAFAMAIPLVYLVEERPRLVRRMRELDREIPLDGSPQPLPDAVSPIGGWCWVLLSVLVGGYRPPEKPLPSPTSSLRPANQSVAGGTKRPDAHASAASNAKTPTSNPPLEFTRDPKSELTYTGKNGTFAIYLPGGEWTRAQASGDAEVVFESSDREVAAQVIAERVEVPFPTLEKIAMANARKVDPDASLVSRDSRRVNGREILCLTMEATIEGMPLTYHGYYHSGTSGTIQIMTWTARNLFDELKPKMESFLNGVVILEPVSGGGTR